MPTDVLPYLVPRPGTVTWGPWELLDSVWITMPSEFEGWDAGNDLVVRRTITVDTKRFLTETGLHPEDLVVTVSWTSSTTGMKDAVPPVRLVSGGFGMIEARLPGDRISGTVDIRTTVCLARPSTAAPPGVARLAGSILDENRQSIVVERGSQMFPVDQIDFAATRLPPEASWHLETSTGDLTAPFFGSFRVLINKRDEELCKAVARGSRDRRQQLLVDELEGGVASLLLEIAVGLQQDLAERTEWPTDTVGDVLARTLAGSHLAGSAPPSASDINVFRTRVAAAVRSRGQGRLFR